jgi:hypothetical protein
MENMRYADELCGPEGLPYIVLRRRVSKMRTSTIQLPLWAEWLKALAPVIAVLTSAFAVYISVLTFRLSRQIANWQTSVARAQLRQNVYDRRFKIYEATKTLLVIYQNNDRLSTEEYLDYRRSTTDAVFLLDDNVVRYLEHIGERVRRFLLLQEQIKENVSGEDAYHRRVNEHAEIGTWFLQQFDILFAKFKPSMRLDEP